jgi:hypothetical protein
MLRVDIGSKCIVNSLELKNSLMIKRLRIREGSGLN